MRVTITGKIALLVCGGLMSVSAAAEECADVTLTPSQVDFLSLNNIQLIKPEGEVATIQRCDINGDRLVDILDIRAISLARNQPIRHPDDPMDYDKNGIINLSDARGCQRLCSLPRCAPGGEPPDEQVDGVLDPSECFQTEDVDNDGNNDQLVTISERTKINADGSKNLAVVFMREEGGETKFFRDAFVGKSADDKLDFHMSKQPAGVIDLQPGNVVIDEPGTVLYENGRPKLLYYWKDGEMLRAPYLVND